VTSAAGQAAGLRATRPIHGPPRGAHTTTLPHGVAGRGSNEVSPRPARKQAAVAAHVQADGRSHPRGLRRWAPRLPQRAVRGHVPGMSLPCRDSRVRARDGFAGPSAAAHIRPCRGSSSRLLLHRGSRVSLTTPFVVARAWPATKHGPRLTMIVKSPSPPTQACRLRARRGRAGRIHGRAGAS